MAGKLKLNKIIHDMDGVVVNRITRLAFSWLQRLLTDSALTFASLERNRKPKFSARVERRWESTVLFARVNLGEYLLQLRKRKS